MAPLANRDSNQLPGFCLIGEADPFISQLLQRFVEKNDFTTALVEVGAAVSDQA